MTGRVKSASGLRLIAKIMVAFDSSGQYLAAVSRQRLDIDPRNRLRPLFLRPETLSLSKAFQAGPENFMCECMYICVMCMPAGQVSGEELREPAADGGGCHAPVSERAGVAPGRRADRAGAAAGRNRSRWRQRSAGTGHFQGRIPESQFDKLDTYHPRADT